MKPLLRCTTWLASLTLVVLALPAPAQAKKPNILVIFGDDIGIWNINAYHRGMMGGSTPNLGRIAKEGALFTDYYSQNSCTAGRTAFITGQSPLRTGLLKVGLPGAKQGLQDKDPTIAELLKTEGYATAQIGKNHLGDRNEFLPTRHGFDEFYGNLYHLNSEEEPEDPDYPKDPEFHKKFGPRGLLDVKATDKEDPTENPRFGKVSKQTIKDTGPLDAQAHGDGRRGTVGTLAGLHRALGQSEQAVFPMAQQHPHACLDAAFPQVGKQNRLWPLCGWHGGTRRRHWPVAQEAG